MYFIYIIKSLKKEWYYVGHTHDKDTRLKYHNDGKVKSTKPYVPFILIHNEGFKTKSEAFKREQQIKKYKHGEAFKKLVAGAAGSSNGRTTDSESVYLGPNPSPAASSTSEW